MQPSAVLVFDPHQTLTDIVARQMDRAGLSGSITTAQSKAEFLAEGRRVEPDLIITGRGETSEDERSPGGLEPLRWIIADFPRTPIILAAESVSPGEHATLLDLGITAVVLLLAEDQLALSMGSILNRAHNRNVQDPWVVQALQRAGRQWRATFDAMEDGICVADVQGLISRANTAFRAMVDLPWDRIIGRNIFSILPGLGQILEAPGRDYGAAGRRVPEFQIARGWYRGRRTRGPGADSGIHEVLYIFSDITAEKQIQLEIAIRTKWIQTINRFSRESVGQLNLDDMLATAFTYLEANFDFRLGCIFMGNEAEDYVDVLGISQVGRPIAQELGITPGQRFTQSAFPQSLQNRPDRSGEILFLGEPTLENSSRIWKRFKEILSRAEISWLVRMPIIMAKRYQMVLYLAYSHEITFVEEEWDFLRTLTEYISVAARNRQLYEELQESYTELDRIKDLTARQQRLEALGQIASGIAHDINNTLVPISLYAEGLVNPALELPPKAVNYAQAIRRAVEDIQGVTSRLRTFYRTEEKAEPEPIDIAELFSQVLELSKPKWKSGPNQHGLNIEVATRIAGDVPGFSGVPGELREALMNLIFNAVDAMPAGGEITLAARRQGSTVFIDVIDTGIGMNHEQLEHCLEPFYTTKGVRGTGMGLPGVYGVVQRHGGGIEMDSTPGSGTRVTLALPITKAARPNTQVLNPGSCTESLRILTVDDDPRSRDAMAELLRFDGHRWCTILSVN
ncbi:ATP-binding protein [Spirochaeta lutea]|uniref:ATP-binding protein n=1 Tax=Spirochaeta lutea TaxID=1480694 RepID=UPI00069222A5|nr:ATP-binding protein [Spirochaeta lutea]